MFAIRHTTGTASGTTTLSTLTQITVRETAGAAAQVQLKSNGTGGTIVMDRNLAANESFTDSFENPLTSSDSDGVPTGAWWINIAAGAVRWSVSGA